MNRSLDDAAMRRYHLLTCIEDNASVFKTLGDLLTVAIEHDETSKSMATGLGILFHTHMTDFEEAADELRGALQLIDRVGNQPARAERDKPLMPPSDLPEYEAVLATNHAILEEVRSAGRAEQEKASPRNLRNKIIVEQLQAGFDAGEIAQAVNLKKETVERVIGQMLATTLHGKSDDDRPSAVNE